MEFDPRGPHSPSNANLLPGFFCFGTNHRLASSAVRESLALGPDEILHLLPQISKACDCAELAILSTCNRFEIYGAKASSKVSGHYESLVTEYSRLQRPAFQVRSELAKASFYLEGEKAIEHVFRVAASLESMVIGETQITAQFKRAFAMARQAATLGPQLQHLSESALKVAKEVRTQTPIGQRSLSLGHAAIELAGSFYSSLKECKLVIVGAGEMARLSAHHAVKKHLSNLVVVNRSSERASRLVAELGCGTAAPWHDLARHIETADIVIAAVNVQSPIIDLSFIETIVERRKNRRLLAIDLGMPRNLDPRIANFEPIFLYELDDLHQTIKTNLAHRSNAADAARPIVASSLQRFVTRQGHRKHSPAIANFKEYLYRTLSRELPDKEVGRVVARLTGDFARELKSSNFSEKKSVTDFVKRLTTH